MRPGKNESLASSGILRVVLAAASLIVAALSLPACKTLPPMNDPAYQRAERDAREALPSEASLFLAMSPSELPELKKEILAALPERDASSLKTILSSTSMIYVAYTPPWGPGSEGMQSWYALLSGKYSSIVINAGLSGSKGVKKTGGWYELSGGIKLALDKDRRILATNADMGSFLERLRAPSLRLEKKDGLVHPISVAAQERTSGARIFAPAAGANLLGELSKLSGNLPIETLSLDIAEEKGKETIDAEFSFQSETSAKVFAPAMRAMLGAAFRMLGLPGQAPELKREGAMLRADGMSATPRELAALFASMAGRKK
jgi:hypothetical protein